MGPEGGEEGSGESKRSDYMEEIQKFAGKLGQELRDQHEKLESDDIKYVLNMIISAVNLDKLSDEDIEDIGKKFDREEKKGNEVVQWPSLLGEIMPVLAYVLFKVSSGTEREVAQKLIEFELGYYQ